MTFSSTALQEIRLTMDFTTYKPSLYRYAKFFAIFPLELLFDGINVSLLRYGSAFVANKITNIAPSICNENSTLILPVEDHNHTLTISDFLQHHTTEISYGAAVFFGVVIPFTLLSSYQMSSVADVMAIPVTFVSHVAHMVIRFLFNVDLRHSKDALITAYEYGHNTFNLFSAAEPLIHTFYYGYCDRESYDEYIYNGSVKEISMSYYLVKNMADIAISSAHDAYEMVFDTAIQPDNI